MTHSIKIRVNDSQILHSHQITQFLAGKAIPENQMGGTLDPIIIQMKNNFDSEVYLVSLFSHEQQFSTVPKKSEIHRWIAPRLLIFRRPHHYVGWWYNPNKKIYYLDVSVPIHGKDLAIVFAQKNRQDAIYHPETQNTIHVPHSKFS